MKPSQSGGEIHRLTRSFAWSGWRDLNSRPLDPQSSALPSCATARWPARGFLRRSTQATLLDALSAFKTASSGTWRSAHTPRSCGPSCAQSSRPRVRTFMVIPACWPESRCAGSVGMAATSAGAWRPQPAAPQSRMERGITGYGRPEKRSKAWRLSPRPRKGSAKDQDQQADAGAADGGLLGIQRTIGNRAFVHMLESRGLLSRAGDEFERHAAEAAKAAGLPTGADRTPRLPVADPVDREAVDSELGCVGPGSPLPDHIRAGAGLRRRLLRRPGAHRKRGGQLNSVLGADAFTYGHDVFYAAGRAPGLDPPTAHELGYVVHGPPELAAALARYDRTRTRPTAGQ